jgi:hypothetical protein
MLLFTYLHLHAPQHMLINSPLVRQIDALARLTGGVDQFSGFIGMLCQFNLISQAYIFLLNVCLYLHAPEYIQTCVIFGESTEPGCIMTPSDHLMTPSDPPLTPLVTPSAGVLHFWRIYRAWLRVAGSFATKLCAEVTRVHNKYTQCYMSMLLYTSMLVHIIALLAYYYYYYQHAGT